MKNYNLRLKNSGYAPEEERQFHVLLTAFHDYISDKQDFFEVLYSEKLGKYIEVIMEKLLWQTEPLWELDSPDSLFQLLLSQMAADIAGPRWDAEYDEIGPQFTPGELTETRRQATEYLDRMPDESLRMRCTQAMDNFIQEETAKAEHYLKTGLRRQAI